GLQSTHETAIRHASGARRGIDANLPKRAIIAFLGLAIAEGVLPAMIKRIGGVAIEFAAAHPEALGGFNRADTAFTGSWSVSYAHKILVAEREVLRNAIRIGRIDLLGSPERTAALGVFSGHQVAFPRA